MKSLKAIQTLSKIGKILSRIVFIFSVVGFGICTAGIPSLALGGMAFKLGGVTLHGILQSTTGISIEYVYAGMAVGSLSCAAQAVLARFAEHYFARELTDGTPFCLDGAKELMRLGILGIAIPLGTKTVAGIVYAVLESFVQGEAVNRFEMGGTVWIGVMFLVLSLFCRYGAELKERAENPSVES